ncbi:carboxymuconolactone decarboxylase family protein [Cellulomonas dongxiuzhuiae]|uniref:carboxymuconolactone decarboxylase family protein n=1 Tax=Cellulomonas dongxiuzhuiae TaxID=2819979 RepID=UPI001AAFCBCF|nr:carboxymuconolactone decarboxylase family protein [Cellulomonas dongxiuzhuiae]MBO3089502.1 carboxymuconolactone decarboxylase family protein [Cellulomonas dongxiuzhuiae]
MARITPPVRRRLSDRIAAAATRRMFGRSLEPAAVTAHHRGVLWSQLLGEVVLLRARHHLPERLRSLVEHRVAVVIGCSWCIDFGAMLALRVGISAQDVLAVPDYAASPAFSDLEKRAMAFADAATATPPRVTDDMVAGLRADLGDAGVVELAHLVALENQRSRLNHALGITAQGFTDATVCALPAVHATAPSPAAVTPGRGPA